MRWFWEKKQMDTLHTLNGKPILVAAEAAAPAVATIPTVQVPNATVTQQISVHRAEAGDVGVVGEVGDLGTNAK